MFSKKVFFLFLFLVLQLSPEGGPSANAPDFQITLQSFNALRKAATRSTSLVSFVKNRKKCYFFVNVVCSTIGQ